MAIAILQKRRMEYIALPAEQSALSVPASPGPQYLAVSFMSTPPTLPIDSRHVALQFARRGDLAGAQFLHNEIAHRMASRLKLIRLQPELILDAGCGAGQRLALLNERYPAARYIGQDRCGAALALARSRHRNTWRTLADRLRGTAPRVQWIEGDLATTGLPPESADLVWSNLALHWHPQPHQVLHEWGRVLRVGGLVFFSCFGPNTLRELREALAVANLQTATPAFVDMHDFGDLLVERGFADPVMDQELITLTYESPDKLLQDVRALGGNPAKGRRTGLAGRAWRERLMSALAARRGPDGRIHLTLEIAYGHAWRSATLRHAPGETHVSVSAIQRKPPSRTTP